MAATRTLRGFTLVELLVVITIIGMLVSLLLPAIQSAREAGRRTTCLNNMRQAAIGLTQAEETQKGFPNYVFTINKSGESLRASWVVSIMPSVEQNVLYQNWVNPTLPVAWTGVPATDNRAQYITQLSILLCPSNSNPNLSDDATSFVINTGIAVTASDNFSSSFLWAEDPASGVSLEGESAGAKKVKMDYISANDGSTNTILVSENLQSGGWATDPSSANSPFLSPFAARQSVGMVWFLTGQHENVTPPTSDVLGLGTPKGYNADAIGINDLGQAIAGPPKGSYAETDTTQASGLAYARPSSYHPGGVNAMFCGGNSRFLNEQIDYKVFTQLMTPNQPFVIVDKSGGVNGTPVRANTKPSATATPQLPTKVTSPYTKVDVPWGYVLDEGAL